jgi:hypothetical protein
LTLDWVIARVAEALPLLKSAHGVVHLYKHGLAASAQEEDGGLVMKRSGRTHKPASATRRPTSRSAKSRAKALPREFDAIIDIFVDAVVDTIRRSPLVEIPPTLRVKEVLRKQVHTQVNKQVKQAARRAQAEEPEDPRAAARRQLPRAPKKAPWSVSSARTKRQEPPQPQMLPMLAVKPTPPRSTPSLLAGRAAVDEEE